RKRTVRSTGALFLWERTRESFAHQDSAGCSKATPPYLCEDTKYAILMTHMNKTGFLLVSLVALTFSVSCAFGTSLTDPPPVAVIFDTDMGPDYDDVGALAVLHAL